MIKISPLLISVLLTSGLSGCVSQTFENDKDTPVIENEASKNEKALTRIQLGLGYLKVGNTQQAKFNLEKAKRFSPNLVQVYTAFAHYFDTVGEPEQAIIAYEKALTLDGDNADTLNNYGVFLCRQDEFAKAEKQILKAIAVPSYTLVAQSYENLSLCQLKAKTFPKAEFYLKKAIDHSPNRASALLQMMRLQYAKADYKSAQAYLYRYEKSARRISSEALALAFKIYDKQHNARTAKNYANMLVKMFPASFESKQYILNGLYRIEADKLATDYQESISGKGKSSKKRVVLLSPKKNNSTVASSSVVIGDLSQNGLQPIMENSVMPNVEQKSEQKAIELATLEAKKGNVGSQSVPRKDENNQSKQSPEVVFKTTKKAKEDVPEMVTEKIIEQNESSETKLETNMVSLPVHFVKKGDSLFSISKRYNIVMKSLEKWNKLRRPYLLKIDDVIYLADPKVSQKEQD